MADNILKIDYEKYSLANGLQVILYPDLSVPVAAVNIRTYDVSGFSKYPEGRTF